MATGTIQGVKQLSPTITKTSGCFTVNSVTAYQYGHIVQIYVVFDKQSATGSKGTDVFVGTISGIPLPKVEAIRIAGYSGERMLTLTIKNDGAISVRTNADLASGATTGYYITGGSYMC